MDYVCTDCSYVVLVAQAVFHLEHETNKQTDRQTHAQTPVNVLPTPRLPSVWAITESKNINWPTAAQQRACLQCYSTTSDLIPVAIPLRCNAINRDRDIEQVATVIVATGRIVADTHIILSY